MQILIVLLLSLVGLLLPPVAGYADGVSLLNPNTQETVLQDSSRQRVVPLKIYMPPATSEGRVPVILFSPGAGGEQDSYDYLGEAWARHGYMVLCLDHPGTDKAASLQYPKLMDFYLNIAKSPMLTVQRLQDVAFVLRSLPTLDQQVPALRNRMDLQRVGMAGHSLGAWTTLVLAGATLQGPDGKKQAFSAPQVKAFIALSPLPNGQLGLTPNSWKRIERPVFTLSGTQDSGPGLQSPVERLQPFFQMPTGQKYHALLQTAEHLDFADKDFPTPKITQVHQTVTSLSLLFWDAYLQQKRSAFASLQQATSPRYTVYRK